MAASNMPGHRPMSADPAPPAATTVESIFVRRRNALLLLGDFEPVITDYFLHLLQHGLRNPPELDRMLKDLLAVFSLHLVARPWQETIAWTANLRAPRVNLFVTGSSLAEAVTGRVFTEDVREPDCNHFYAQTTAPNLAEPRLSSLQVDGRDPVNWVEQYYLQSEQRPGRAFRLDGDRYALLAAQPDCDHEWFANATAATIADIARHEETTLLETRRLRFHCGCTLERILPILGSWRHRPDDLFAGAHQITVQCPRCAARYQVTRDMI
jgi:molecular chaperone Hsp33